MNSNKINWVFGRATRVILIFLGGVVLSQRSFASFDHSHSGWNDVLKKFVVVSGTTSEILYGKLKDRGNVAGLDAYLRGLEGVSLAEFKKFTRYEQLAFLINAYNAFTVKLILNHFPVKSIKDIGGIFSNPWNKKFLNLLGRKRHLDSIEHGMIRRQEKAFKDIEVELRQALSSFNEARIHFVLNCASKGCPALKNEPYLSSKLEEQLEGATKDFLSDKSKNIFDPVKNELKLSSIFKWYGHDFEKASGSTQAFVAPRMASSKDEENKINHSKIYFLDYDWSINGK